MSGKGGGSSQGQNTNTKDTQWNQASTLSSNAANAVQGVGLDDLSNGSLLNPNVYNLANQAYGSATSGLTPSNDIYGNVANAAGNVSSTPAYTGLQSLANGTGTGQSELQALAAGGNSNPEENAMFAQGAGQVQQALAGQFNSAGRLGSGAQEFNTSQGLNNLATDIYGGQYAQNQANALSAASTLGSQALGANEGLGSLTNSGLGLDLSAAGGLSGNYSSLLSGLNTASGLNTGISNYGLLSDYSNLASPYLGLNTSTQNNNSFNYDDTGSFQNDLGYVGDVASLLGSFA